MLLAVLVLFTAKVFCGQTLAPRAYLITPVGSNAVTVSSSFYHGGVLFDNSVPITGASGNIGFIFPTYYRALSFFGRSANIVIGLPFTAAGFEAFVVNQEQSTHRVGLADGIVRFSVNLKGGPAMTAPEFIKWKQKRLLGASIVVQFPSGQYDPTRLVNIGNHRWAFKPELGYSERWGKWLLDAYGAVWFFTSNPEFFSRNSFFPGTRQRTQEPIAVMETHLSYDVKPRLWVSVDANFWIGGKTSLNGVQNPDTLQRNSRVGATAAIPFTRHQSLKFSYDRGAFIRFGGNYQAISVAWQYAWVSGVHK